MREIPILFENSFCLVLNKPPGLPVQGGKGIKNSLDSILSEKFHPRPFLVHRLDRDTSGLVLVARTKEAAREFSFLFASNSVHGSKSSKGGKILKQYQGLCSGLFERESGVIRLSLDLPQKGRNKAGRVFVRKESETFFRRLYPIVCSLPEGDLSCSLLELELGTGRMHQIRRHLAMEGHPILGDDKYGDFPLNKKLKKAYGLKNLLLHASRIAIPPSAFIPGGLNVSAPLPDYFSSFIEKFIEK